MSSVWSHSFPFVCFQYETLVVFDTSQNDTRFVAVDPALYWIGGALPDDEPENIEGRHGVEVVWVRRESGLFWSFWLSSLFVPVCACLPPGLDTQEVIMIVLGVSVVVVTAIALIFYR